ncbi:Aldo/keto reductase [Stereum hirsutum FP-91666 SS1]|uniref:Aldo/keto reductase n=1 Tax=Stereum hirsutum (strain FP-91666) TaxID=721885 RepID=UPI0004449C11|nr:Aldo/keto reductase [Stereum hirsutum FP-91666 SS1]EIM83189.1 Aldo/keto reductase [Stereum hirsutum FP-91666 SS1]
MTFSNITLNDGAKIPSIAFGTGSVWKGQDVVTYIDQALEAGFSHIDTAAIYKNEDSVGTAIRESGLQRSDLYITTKFDGGIIRDALLSSLSKIGIKSVDLYLIHFPGVIADGDLEGAWAQMEAVRDEGLAKSIGVSNFKVADLKRVVKVAKVIPVVNQIRFHPYNFAEYAELLEYSAQYGIVTEAYGSLAPITTFPNGPLSPLLSTIAKRLSTDEKVQATPAQVIFKWVQSKGAVIVTTSGKKERLEEYLAVESLREFSTIGQGDPCKQEG